MTTRLCSSKRLHAIITISTLLATLAFAATTYAKTKILPNDPGEDHLFGSAVGIHGNHAIVGSWGDDHRGTLSGSAYLFDATTGMQTYKLIADDAAMGDRFGESVGVSGNHAIVGAFHNDENGLGSGAAYIFNATTGQQIHKLAADDAAADDYLGSAVGISGNLAVVGAYGDDDFGSFSGSAYVFNATTGQQVSKLNALDADEGDYFGRSVGISGGIAIVGAIENDDHGTRSGSAYLFNATTGEQFHKLTADDAAEDDRFGHAVAISGNTAIVGAQGNDDDGSFSGSAYLFDVTTGEQLFKLTADDAASGDGFGISVAISGDIAIVGAWHDDDHGQDSGSAYFFDITTGEQITKITASDAAEADFFGAAVAIAGNNSIIGAFGNDDFASRAGSAYLYEIPEPASLTLLSLLAPAFLRRRH
ncbi:FG-GAP repeat protein [Poriferisphaera sp. WC338]|uniref:FG-GAP repeat protein n=1 Tax=Poriferisphaera sp. WC338 TaxID=3425129 RepID=UPI003D813F25